MRLYHGSSTVFKSQLLKAMELKPRANKRGNYEGSLISQADRVYLTDVYAIQFGMIAALARGGRPLIVTVEVDPDDLLPDTDFNQYETGLECLQATGTCSIARPVAIADIYIPDLSWWKENEELVSTKISTNIMHKAFYQRNLDQHEAVLMYSNRITW